jgi:hypothetical protein
MRQIQEPQQWQQASGNPLQVELLPYEFLLSLVELDAHLLSLAGPEQVVALTFPHIAMTPSAIDASSTSADEQSVGK